VEGPTDDPEIKALRARQQRNFLATLFLSQGTPMLLGGDERGRTQLGNNNAWCQDNEISWYDWTSGGAVTALEAFVRRLILLRAEHPVLRRERYLSGRELRGSGLPDAWWFRADGRKLTRQDWHAGEPLLGVFLNGREIVSPGPHGEEIIDDSFVLLFNALGEERTFTLPWPRFGARWALELSTSDPDAEPGSLQYGARTEIEVPARSVVVLRRVA
jgi:glycogen operon protein